jgi:hypothetical protein
VRFEKNLDFFENFASQIPEKLVTRVVGDETILQSGAPWLFCFTTI